MIHITQPAADNISKALQTRGKGIGIKIGVKTSGCSGLAYTMEFSDQVMPDDLVFTDKNITIITDPKSKIYLDGTVIDYAVEGLNSGFKFTNPNAKGECGCGESFTV